MPSAAATDLKLLARGPYVTAFPESLVHAHRGAEDLRVLPVTLARALPVTAVMLQRRTHHPAIAAFIATAQAESRIVVTDGTVMREGRPLG